MSDNSVTQPPTNTKTQQKNGYFWLSCILLAVICAMIAGFFAWKNANEPKIETISREGVINKIQTLSRLQTVVYNVDTVITSEKQGNWYALWQDGQKGLFVGHGQVQAGIDLNALTPDNVEIITPTDNTSKQMITITLPPAQIFNTFLNNIEVYDIETGVFGMVDIDKQLFNQAQTVGKQQVLATACRADILTLATDNAQKQVQALFALADLQVTIKTVPAKTCG